MVWSKVLLDHDSNRAIVIGASIAGLMTANVMAKHFDEVIVLDRDELPEAPVPRTCVPQEHHVHLLLERGRRIMEQIFPGLMTELEAEGAQAADLCLDVKCNQAGRWKRRWRSGITAHYCTRTLLEFVLRRRVSSSENIKIVGSTPVRHVNICGITGKATGVRLDISDGQSIDIPARFVVDATGRGSRSEVWLEDAGFGRVEREEIITRLGYVSGIYEPPRQVGQDWRVLLCLPKIPEQRRMAVVSPIEGQRWMVTAGAWFDEQPALDEKAFLSYLQSLPIPDLHQAVEGARRLAPLRRYRMPGGLRRHYEKMTRWPEGFLVIGDAVCSMNPLYSQGMSASALQVETLMSHLKRLLSGALPFHRVQVEICASVDLPWQQAASVEQQFETPSKAAPWPTRLKRAYFKRLVSASIVNRQIAIAMLKVNNLIASPASLYAPHLVISALLSVMQPLLKGERT
ncbi:FAD-dependent oxidoreductase [Rhizobium rhizogenes]|uniref:FAD-dependent oxidoreductase n=1 Tax=Rhizobium rhizogenes TaxID=359 RepID=UPI001572DCA3|nr:FAD-dependent monooxygenase [Rhizobium rhizogenes]NTF85387.1 hypothetical protein [Rhizobium rhizogenes]